MQSLKGGCGLVWWMMLQPAVQCRSDAQDVQEMQFAANGGRHAPTSMRWQRTVSCSESPVLRAVMLKPLTRCRLGKAAAKQPMLQLAPMAGHSKGSGSGVAGTLAVMLTLPPAGDRPPLLLLLLVPPLLLLLLAPLALAQGALALALLSGLAGMPKPGKVCLGPGQ